jgi:hypothetical protein
MRYETMLQRQLHRAMNQFGTVATAAAGRGRSTTAGDVGLVLNEKFIFAKRTHLEYRRKTNSRNVKSEFWQTMTGFKTNPYEPIQPHFDETVLIRLIDKFPAGSRVARPDGAACCHCLQMDVLPSRTAAGQNGLQRTFSQPHPT